MKIEDKELERFKFLVNEARSAPILLFEIKHNEDMSTRAWERVYLFMKDMAAKYNYNFKENVINTKTGEIITVEEAKRINEEFRKEEMEKKE